MTSATTEAPPSPAPTSVPDPLPPPETGKKKIPAPPPPPADKIKIAAPTAPSDGPPSPAAVGRPFSAEAAKGPRQRSTSSSRSKAPIWIAVIGGVVVLVGLIRLVGALSSSNGGTASSGTDAYVPGTMPSLTGMVLQDAQDRLQSLGSYSLDQEDASGQGRFQILDSNWQVCRQSPAPGAPLSSSTTVTLWSVKLDESC